MKLLHPYSNRNDKNELETWQFFTKIYELQEFNSLSITHLKCNDNHITFTKWMIENWGKDDLIVVEADKVPTLDNLRELISCKAKFCCFPYQFSYIPWITTRLYWDIHFPYTLGFVKFTKEVQLSIPTDNWGYDKYSLDRAIEIPMIAKFGMMHIHREWIKHNHGILRNKLRFGKPRFKELVLENGIIRISEK